MNFLVLKHAAREGLGLWEECCREAGIALEVVALHQSALLPPPHQFQAVISLGGPMSVHDEATYPFLRTEDTFIRQVVAEGIPFLGVCLGGQLLAKALGGRVAPNVVKEIGWHFIELDQTGQRDPLFAGLPDRFPVFQWHGATFSIPKGAIRLATSPACENQAFRFGFGGIAYALQFHLEVTPSLVEEWTREYAAELADLDGAGDARDILAETAARCEVLGALSRRVFRNFCRLVQVRFAGVGAARPPQPQQPVRRRSPKVLTVEEARQRFQELMAKGKLRCGITCPLDRIGQCTGGCW